METPKDVLEFFYKLVQDFHSSRPNPQFSLSLQRAGIKEITPPSQATVDARLKNVPSPQKLLNNLKVTNLNLDTQSGGGCEKVMMFLLLAFCIYVFFIYQDDEKGEYIQIRPSSSNLEPSMYDPPRGFSNPFVFKNLSVKEKTDIMRYDELVSEKGPWRNRLNEIIQTDRNAYEWVPEGKQPRSTVCLSPLGEQEYFYSETLPSIVKFVLSLASFLFAVPAILKGHTIAGGGARINKAIEILSKILIVAVNEIEKMGDPTRFSVMNIPSSGKLVLKRTNNNGKALIDPISFIDFKTGDKVAIVKNKTNSPILVTALQAWIYYPLRKGLLTNPVTKEELKKSDIKIYTLELSDTNLSVGGKRKSRKAKKTRKATRKH